MTFENFENIFKDGKLWMIVGRSDAVEFVRYSILKCNWNFKWIAKRNGKKEIYNVYGCNRIANSYTSWKFLIQKLHSSLWVETLVVYSLELLENPKDN